MRVSPASTNGNGYVRQPVDVPHSSAPRPYLKNKGRQTEEKERRAHRRRVRVYARAQAAVERWRRHLRKSDDIGSVEIEQPVLRDLPRPGKMGLPDVAGDQSDLPSLRREVTFKAGIFHSAARLCVWIFGGLLFAGGVVVDWVRGRNSMENRARRLREAFEQMGTTFIKVGQQLSMRLDLLPFVYTRELEKMLDRAPPFPVEIAIKTIERASGLPLSEVFSGFDPRPVGSASVACVYQAVLRNGESVAVKVRRPGIGARLAADMRALRWLAMAAEQLMFTPGYTANFVFELNTMLMEELDFTREARFADLYRRRVRKTRQLHFVSAPKVFFEYSSEEVMVSRFVSGIWMKDLLPALDSANNETIERLKELNIDPVILSRRIQLIARFNNFESIFFHADLHPGNILVKPNNKIVLIDFGSCGSFSNKELNSWRRWFDAQSVNDVGGMVHASMAILEPLPPIDRDNFGLRLEYMFSNDLYAIKSKHSQWSERISSRLWMGFLKLSREFKIPLRLNMLRMIRASMLTDTIAARLDNNQNPYREFRRYEVEAGRRAKARLKRRFHRLLGPSKYIRMEQGLDSAVKLVYEIQRTVDSLSSIRIGAIIGRVEYFVTLMLRALSLAGVTLCAMTLFILLAKMWRSQKALAFWGLNANTSVGFNQAGLAVLHSDIWRLIALATVSFVLWRVSFRLQERKPWGNS